MHQAYFKLLSVKAGVHFDFTALNSEKTDSQRCVKVEVLFNFRAGALTFECLSFGSRSQKREGSLFDNCRGQERFNRSYFKLPQYRKGTQSWSNRNGQNCLLILIKCKHVTDFHLQVIEELKTALFKCLKSFLVFH